MDKQPAIIDIRTPRARPKAVKLTPQQERLWSDTRVALLWEAPAFSHIFYTMLDTLGSEHVALFTADVPIAATDGTGLLLNPETFFQFNLKERVFIVAHEIMHCIFNHCAIGFQMAMRGKVAYPDGLELEYNDKMMNVALDLVINDGLIESKTGQFNKSWLHDPKIATNKDSGTEAYRKIYEQQKGGKGGGKPPPMGGGGQGFDEHLAPGTSQGKDGVTASQQRNEAEWQTALSQAMNAAKAQGKLPANLERMFGDILNPTVDWREKIQSLFARKVGAGTYDWRKPDRHFITRDIYAPARSGFGAGTVIVGVDTSGSIGPKELDMFFAEMAGILEDVRPRQLLVVWCDAQIGRVDECDEPGDLNHVRSLGAPGGGGTSFIPVFEYAASLGSEIDALVYLTDGMGTFPDVAPSYPVIWGSIYPQSQYPFGDVVDIPIQHT